MSAFMPELRKPVMTWVEASWDDGSGELQIASARMEDKSSGGACIRLKTRIGVGSKLQIKWRFEQFSGTTKYCRSEGDEYVVGIQRDAVQNPVPDLPSLAKTPPEPLTSSHPLSPNVKAPDAAGAPSIKTGETEDRNRIRHSHLQEFDAIRRAQRRTTRRQRQADKEIEHIRQKFLELVPWRKQDQVSVIGSGAGDGSGDGTRVHMNPKENLMTQTPLPEKDPPVDNEEEAFGGVAVELLPMEDIYRLAGIMEPHKGYSIKKVVEMLRSRHIRGLSKEMQRAAVLMALDAAGVSVAQVESDAKARQFALDAHEADQRKQVEADWARKTEEISHIQNEMECARMHFMSRISRNLDGVAREKATFNSWVAIKQQEAQSMAEALELCLKPPLPEAATPPKAVSPTTTASPQAPSEVANAASVDIRLSKAASTRTM
jgi:hypothetical protein